MRFTLLSLLWLCVAVSCVDSPADDDPDADCARLRDHSIELSLRSASEEGAAHLSEEVIAAHKAQLSATLAPAYATRCEELTTTQLHCSLGANTMTELTACTGGTP